MCSIHSSVRRLQLFLTVILLPLMLFVLSATCGLAATITDLVGKWGYTVLGHGVPFDRGFYTWKDEAGTMIFGADTMTCGRYGHEWP